MSPQQAAAITNNEKVFPIFAKKLSTDDEGTFCHTAGKLSMWLSSEKAYYTAARPKIVKLLEVAEATLRRQKGGDSDEPIHIATYPPHLTNWVNAYSGLLRTVVRFLETFSEQKLLDRLQVLFQTGKLILPSTSLSPAPLQLVIPSQQQDVVPSWQPHESANIATQPPGPASSISRWVSSQPVDRPMSAPTPAMTMHASSSSLASALDGPTLTLSVQLSSTVKSRAETMPPLSPSTAVPAPTIEIVAAQVSETETSADETHPPSNALDSDMNAVVVPSQAPVLLPQVDVVQPQSVSRPETMPPMSACTPAPAPVAGIVSTTRVLETETSADEAHPPLNALVPDTDTVVISSQAPVVLPQVDAVQSQSISLAETMPPRSAYMPVPAPMAEIVSAAGVLETEPSADGTHPPSNVLASDMDAVVAPPQAPIVLPRTDDIQSRHLAVFPSQASADPSAAVVSGGPSAIKFPITSVHPTIPTPAQVLNMSTPSEFPSIRHPAPPVSQKFPNNPSLKTINLVPADFTSTQSTQPVFSSSSSPIPVPEPIPFSASSSSVVKEKKKKITIPEDLALSDLEWLKMKRKKDSVAHSKSTPSPAISMGPRIGEEGHVMPVSNQSVLSDQVWLEKKRRKDFDAVYTPTVPGETKDVAGPAVELRQLVNHPDLGQATTTSQDGRGYVVNDAVPTTAENIEQTTDVVLYAAPSDSTVHYPQHADANQVATSADHDEVPQPMLEEPMDIEPSGTDHGVAGPTHFALDGVADNGDSPTAHPSSRGPQTPGDMEMSGDTTLAKNDLATFDDVMTEPAGGIPDSAQIGHRSNESSADAEDGELVEQLLNPAEPGEVLLDQQAGKSKPSSAKHLDLQTTAAQGEDPSSTALPAVASGSVDHSMTPHCEAHPITGGLDHQDAIHNESSAIREATPQGAILYSNTAETSGMSDGSSMSGDGAPTGSSIPSSPMEISPPLASRQYRHQSSSPRPKSNHSLRSMDSSHGPLDTATNETTAVKQECISEVDVLQFLNAISLDSATSNITSLPRVIPVPSREPRIVDFGPEMVVIAARRGSRSQAGLSINVSINNYQMSLISMWVNRKSTGDVSQTMCLSLACYHWADLHPLLQSAHESQSLGDLLRAVRCSWPSKGGLSMVVQHGQGEWHLPLSPPLAESSENLVDISSFVRPEMNTFQIHQRSDMSGFVFVLHAHFPTCQQLQVVARQREKSEQFRGDLKEWSRPLDAPLPLIRNNGAVDNT